MASELEVSIATYQAQLEQIELALSADSTNEELIQLKNDLNQLITLTTESLLEHKKKELLERLGNDDEEVPKLSEEPKPVEEPKLDLSQLEGMRCRAPFLRNKNLSSSAESHNAVVMQAELVEDEVEVRVMFTHPTNINMLPCQFYLNGKCKFEEDSALSRSRCKFSHGQVVQLSQLEEFEEPDFEGLKKGDDVLAKSETDNLWHHAVVEKFDEEDREKEEIYVNFRQGKDTEISKVSLNSVWPLAEDDDEEDEFEDIDNSLNETFNPAILRVNVGPIGDWESHTRGIGSKLMTSMGYVPGEGLGRRGEGRVEPVSAVIYPAGKSLDWCMEKREAIGECKDSYTAEKVLARQKRKEEARSRRRYLASKAKEKRENQLFDFINQLSGGRKESKLKKCDLTKEFSLSKTGGASTSGKKEEKVSSKTPSGLSNVEGFKIEEDIKKITKDITKLKESLNRNRRDPALCKNLESRLKQKEDQLRSLRSKDSNLRKSQGNRAENKKLTIF